MKPWAKTAHVELAGAHWSSNCHLLSPRHCAFADPSVYPGAHAPSHTPFCVRGRRQEDQEAMLGVGSGKLGRLVQFGVPGSEQLPSTTHVPFTHVAAGAGIGIMPPLHRPEHCVLAGTMTAVLEAPQSQTGTPGLTEGGGIRHSLAVHV